VDKFGDNSSTVTQSFHLLSSFFKRFFAFDRFLRACIARTTAQSIAHTNPTKNKTTAILNSVWNTKSDASALLFGVVPGTKQ